MFEAFFTDPCMRYRTEVINGIDFYGLGFSMVRGECVAEGTLRWMQEGEAAAVLITNTSLPDMSGFELARYVRRQFPCLRVIFLTDTPNLAEAQQAVRCGAYDYLPKSDGIDALRSAMIRVSEELHTESREEAYLRGQQNWDECISRLLKLLLALKPGIDEDHWQMYSKVKPLLSDAPLRMEALLVRSLMEELRAEICRRDEALAAQLRSNMMAAPLGMLTSAQGTAAYMDAIWALLSEKGYITQEDALKSDPIGRACVYMQSHLSEKLTVQELAEYVHISPRHFIRKFQTEMNEKFTDYLAHIRVQAAIQMLEAGRKGEQRQNLQAFQTFDRGLAGIRGCNAEMNALFMQRLQNGRQISNALDTFVLRKALLIKIPDELSLQIPRVNRCLRVHRFQRRLHVNRHIQKCFPRE